MSHLPPPTQLVDSHRDVGVRTLGDDQALNWFVKLNSPDVTDGERMAFNRWLGLDPQHRRCFAAVLRLWQRLGPDPTADRLP